MSLPDASGFGHLFGGYESFGHQKILYFQVRRFIFHLLWATSLPKDTDCLRTCAEFRSFVCLRFVMPAGRFNQNMHEGAIDFSVLFSIWAGDFKSGILPVYDIISRILVF